MTAIDSSRRTMAKSADEAEFEDSRYKLGTEIGRGTWGTVYSATDTLTGDEVAIKLLTPTELAQQQMNDRNITPLKAMQKENGFRASRNVLPRMFNLDSRGRPFIVMPLCPGKLEDVLQDDGYRNCLNKGYPSREKIADYMRDLANGLAEYHTVWGRVHADLKPDNILVDETGRLVINDLGTSTCARLGWSVSPRDNMGFINTRAPECFGEDSHPTTRSDVYSASAILYRLIAPEYPLENELRNARNPRTFFEQIGGKEIDRIIKRKVRQNIPKELRGLLTTGLSYDEYARYADGELLSRAVNSAVSRFLESPAKQAERRIRKYATGFLAPLFIFGVLTVGGWIKRPAETNERSQIQPQLRGPLYLTNGSQGDPIPFDIENDLVLPEVVTAPMIDSKEIDHNAKIVCGDKTTAYLTAEYLRVNLATGLLSHAPLNEHQQRTWAKYSDLSLSAPASNTFSPYAQVAKNIEVALHQAKTADGHVDLEDLCVITRLGPDVLRQAQKASSSLNFKEYIEAKDSKGKYVIDQNEQDFLKQWISNIRDENYHQL